METALAAAAKPVWRGQEPPRHQALELAASDALARGAYAEAFALADRRCRIHPPPEAHSYVLRAEAAYGLGDRKGALADLGMAVAISPDDISANRRLFAWGRGKAQEVAAAALIAADRQPKTLRKCIAFLRRRGRRSFAAATILDDAVRGWAAWPRDDRVEVTIAGEGASVTIVLDPDPFHPLATHSLRAAAFRLARPRSSRPQMITLADGNGSFLSLHAAENERALAVTRTGGAKTGAGEVAVIVPVYADFRATRACLDILVRELDRDARHRAIIVNDAAPDPRMAPYLARIGEHSAVTVLTNERNLGFVASVNRGIAAAGNSSVLLLNADTIPPLRFIERLSEAATRSDRIGIVVPLSNHAEMTSFPMPGVANPLAGPEEARRLDDIAARVNAGKVVDIPAGTGFCMYVSRECLEATGALHDRYHRGYLEDVDFCLRARERGFHTVCDPAVYVGHVGSRSFGSEKSGLVLRNFRILEQQFPGYAGECGAFAAADPLRPARAAIEAVATAERAPARLLIAGTGALGVVARERARQIMAGGEEVILAEVRSGGRVALMAADGGIPQSMAFGLDTERARRELATALGGLALSAIEIADPANVAGGFLEVLLGIDVPLDLLVADAALFDLDWSRVIERARHVIAPSRQALHFARTRLGRSSAANLVLAETTGAVPPRARKAAGGKLGIVPVRRSAAEMRLIGEIAGKFSETPRAPAVVILGETLDDERLMDRGIFVTGKVAPDDLVRLTRCHGIGSIFTGFGPALFGHPLITAALSAGLPAAYLDWSGGRATPNAGDLPIKPSASSAQIATALAGWIGGP